MTHFQRAAAIIAAVLVVHAFAVTFDWYDAVKIFDIPMHFAGGFAMAFLGAAVWHFLIERADVHGAGPLARYAPVLVRFMFIIGFVALVGIAWEWFEYGCDRLFPTFVEQYRTAQPNIGDTMADFFFDLLGGATAFFIIKRSQSL